MSEEAVVYVNVFEKESVGSDRAIRATGTLKYGGKEAWITVEVPEQAAGETGADAYTREFEKVCAALKAACASKRVFL